MDTYMTFEARGKRAEEAVNAAMEEVKRLDALLSTGSASSEVSVINSTGKGTVSEDTAKLLARAREIYESTEGLFDITVYPLMELWGFSTGSYYVPTKEELENVRTCVGMDRLTFDGTTLTLDQGQKIDFGGIAKGYTAAKIMKIFESYGIEDGMVSLGGNIQSIGKNESGQPWNIGIRDPKGGPGDAIASIRVSGKAVVTSGGYERYFQEGGKTYIHILNPKTGYPAEEGLASVTVVSADGTLADALSTSLYLMGASAAADYWREHSEDFDMILITENEEIYVTEGLAQDFQCEREFEIISESSGLPSLKIQK